MKKLHLLIPFLAIMQTISAQNVGIGTTTPSSKLEVAGELKITNIGYGLRHTDGITSVGTYAETSAGWIGTFSNHPLWFFINDSATPGMVLDVAGKVGIGTIAPSEKLEVTGKTKTTDFQMTNGAMNGHVLQSDANGNASWAAPSGGSLIPFSTGTILNGASVVSAAPILMGFGSHAVETINFSGESVSPPEAGGFAFIIPFTGTIENLTISADLLVSSVSAINSIPLVYDFTIFRAPSVPNDGTSHVSASYLTTPLSASLTFGGPANNVFPGTFYSATNINLNSLAVTAGDRIGVRIRTPFFSDISASDISQLSFSASLFYKY